MPRQTAVATKLEKIEQEQTGQERTVEKLASSSASTDDATRQEVAKKFVKYYFGLFAAILILVPLYNLAVYLLTHNTELFLSLKDMILTYSAVAGPTLGLVIAYYFKSKTD